MHLVPGELGGAGGVGSRGGQPGGQQGRKGCPAGSLAAATMPAAACPRTAPHPLPLCLCPTQQGVEIGIGIGVGVSLVVVIYRVAFPRITTLGRLPGTSIYR